MKTIFITGGSKGIGKELVRDFAKKGHKVIFTYHFSKNKSEKIVQELNNEGYDNVMAYQCDMGNEEEVKSLLKHILLKKRSNLRDFLFLIKGHFKR